ncbi:hypothetical protein [Mechercharimyces sp. CAU 1602]|uniref:hypothetical protein n=1 Tax=Mechercharimyces sp. CAU 1602 TaxID=2973933 RepID=UPI0037C9D799
MIHDVDEYQVCLDTSKMVYGECPVVDWDLGGESCMRYDDFLDYVIDMFSNALDDMEN